MSIIRRRPASTPEPQLDPVAEALAAQLLQQWTQDGAAQRTDDQDGDGQPGDNWASDNRSSDNRSSDHQDSDNWDSDGQPAHVAGEEAVVNDQNDTARPSAGLRVDIVTIFPSYLEPLELSLIGRARTSGLIDVQIHDLRDFTADRHRTVDDAPAGGGAGMVMRPEPWGDAIASLLVRGRKALGQEDAAPLLLIPSPSGATLTQGLARDLAQVPWLAIACGRYEGIDERVFDEAAAQMPVLPVSLGDYVLNGGEVAALAIVEAVGRLVPGVVGNAESLVEESYEDGLLEYPVYTRPASWRGRDVPPVLSSGHHAKIKRWRRDQALERTAQRRPDLIERLDPARLDGADLVILTAAGWRLADGRFQPPAWPVAD